MKSNIIISPFLLSSFTLAQSLLGLPVCAVSPISLSTLLLAYANLAGSNRALLMRLDRQGAP